MKPNRRNFLKFLLVSIGAFLIGKFFGSGFGSQKSQIETETEKDFKTFKVTEKGNEITFYDQGGAKILVLDKEVF